MLWAQNLKSLVLAFAVFPVVRIIYKLKAAAVKESLPEAEVEPTPDPQIVLLTEINGLISKHKLTTPVSTIRIVNSD